MRVLALVHAYAPHRSAGAETHLHAMLAALADRGHQVDVSLSRQHGTPYELDGVRVATATLDPKRDLWGNWHPRPDLLVTHLENSPRAMALGRLNQVPVAVVVHNGLPQTFDPIRAPWARADLVVANSEWLAAHTEAEVPGARVEVVRPIADPAVYATVPGDLVTLVNLRRTAFTPESTNSHTKGGELFAELVARMPDTGFLGVTGAYGVQQELAGHHNAEVVGHVPHHRMVADVYARTRILLMPSSYESWGRVASEAMCSGIPVVAHPTVGLRECLGSAGIFVDRQDVAGWTRALRELAHPARWSQASARSTARAEELDALRAPDLARWCDAAEHVAEPKVVA